MHAASALVDLVRWNPPEDPQVSEDVLVREEPLEIRVQGQCIAITMRTPGEDAELAAGFLLSEGVIQNRDDILDIASCQRGEAAEHQNVLNVFLAPSVIVDFKKLTRHVYTSSSCGLCGKASIEAVHQHFPKTGSAVTMGASVLLELPNRLRAYQRTFAQTGGLHAAALFNLEGHVVAVREDVGVITPSINASDTLFSIARCRWTRTCSW